MIGGSRMISVQQKKPKKRTKLRLMLGITFYRCKRYIEWYTNRKTYASQKQNDRLPYSIYTHQTLLLRKLKNVDMWYQHNKIINLKLAIKRIDGLIIKPGETFSYWKCIGKTTRKKGYVDGMVLHSGTFKPGVGGGLCQLSNLIYWMTLHTPLIVTERYRHSYDVFPDSNRTQPFGSGATCSYNYIDLQITNRTNVTYQLSLSLSATHLIGEWRATEEQLHTYKVYEKQHAIHPAIFGGYIRHNIIHRKVYNKQKVEIDDEFITENTAIMMYEPLLDSPKQ